MYGPRRKNKNATFDFCFCAVGSSVDCIFYWSVRGALAFMRQRPHTVWATIWNTMLSDGACHIPPHLDDLLILYRPNGVRVSRLQVCYRKMDWDSVSRAVPVLSQVVPQMQVCYRKMNWDSVSRACPGTVPVQNFYNQLAERRQAKSCVFFSFGG